MSDVWLAGPSLLLQVPVRPVSPRQAGGTRAAATPGRHGSRFHAAVALMSSGMARLGSGLAAWMLPGPAGVLSSRPGGQTRLGRSGPQPGVRS